MDVLSQNTGFHPRADRSFDCGNTAGKRCLAGIVVFHIGHCENDHLVADVLTARVADVSRRNTGTWKLNLQRRMAEMLSVERDLSTASIRAFTSDDLGDTWREEVDRALNLGSPIKRW